MSKLIPILYLAKLKYKEFNWYTHFKTDQSEKKENLNDIFPEMLINMLISFEKFLKTFDLNTFKSLKSCFSGIARFSIFEFFIHRY